MNLEQHQDRSLLEDGGTVSKLRLNLDRCRKMDQTANMDMAAAAFRFEECRDLAWNPENFSLMYGTPLWEQASAAQKIKLNQLYWVANYAQIISAEIATIFFNQTAAAGLYGYEDFRLVCDTLDVESAQERAHIHVFKTVGEKFEEEVFGRRIFTYPMRSPFVKTMLYGDLNRIDSFWRNLQLRGYALLSSGNAFIGCQYFTVRGLRTLNGKIVQHQLSQFYLKHPERDAAPLPAKISYYHFVDESFHFNTSACVSHDVVNSLREPTKFESWVANKTLRGCQQDHFHFSTAINGIFWHDPALMPAIYAILKSPVFAMDDGEARQMMWRCFGRENDGMHASRATHLLAIDSYKRFLADFKYVSAENKEMKIMSGNSMERHLRTNRGVLQRLYGAEGRIGHA